MTQQDMTKVIEVLASRLDTLDKTSVEYRVLLAEMDGLAARLARQDDVDQIDETVEAMFDNMPV
jgi:ABC-type transporter Mla subunit MlaD